MERHQIDKNDLAIKSEIISLVSFNLRKYERAYEEAHGQKIDADEDKLTVTGPPSIMEEILQNIKDFFATF